MKPETLKERMRQVADEFEKYVGADGRLNATAVIKDLRAREARIAELQVLLDDALDQAMNSLDQAVAYKADRDLLIKALQQCRSALVNIDEDFLDILGMGRADGYVYPYRDELLRQIDAALYQKPEEE